MHVIRTSAAFAAAVLSVATALQAPVQQASGLDLRARAASAIDALRAVLPEKLRPAARYADAGITFKSYFGMGVNWRQWDFADGWANGQPFNCGWSKSSHHVKNGVLSLDVKKETFKDQGSATGKWNTYPYTSGEIRSRGFHGVGCYAACMKPMQVSGMTCSFYAHSGEHDIPIGFHDSNPLHNEIDLEFVGKDTTRVQTNFFSRHKDPHANSGSGVEQMHDLGFDAASNFHVYGFKWTHGKIEWFVDGRKIRTEHGEKTRMPSPDYSPMRIVANAWPVNKQAEEWAGPLDHAVYQASAEYAWMKFIGGPDCQVASSC